MINPHTQAAFSISLLNVSEAVKNRLVEEFGKDDIDTLTSTPELELTSRAQRAFPNDPSGWRLIIHTIKSVLPDKRMVLINPLTGDVESTGLANTYGVDLSMLSYEQLAAIEWGWRTAHPRLPEFLPSNREEMTDLQQRLFVPNSNDSFEILLDYRVAIGRGEVITWEGNRETPRDKVHELRNRFNAPPETEAECRAFVLRNVREEETTKKYEGRVTGVFHTLHVKAHNNWLKDVIVVDTLVITGYNTRGRAILAPGCTIDTPSGRSYYEWVYKTWREIYAMIPKK